MTQQDKATAVIQEARICLLAGARIKNSADPTDALLVLLSGPLSELHGSLFLPANLSALVKEQFGWELSAEAIECFIPKMRHLGWLQSQANLPSGGPYIVDLPEPESSDAEVDTREALTALGVEFQAFAKELSPFESLPEESVEAGAILLKHVVDANLPISIPNGKAHTDEAFLADRFIEHVNTNKLPAKDVLSSLSAVGFLVRVAEEISNPSKRRSVDLRVVVDGPILLDYLGCSGPIRSSTVADIFERLRAMGAVTVTFNHCVEEAQDALKSVLRTPARDRYGPTGEALRKGLVHENALVALLASFDSAVRAKTIEILPDTIDFNPQSFKYFDETLVSGVDEIVNWHDEDNKNARYADSDTTVLTIRRRSGHRTSDLFSSKYVCVTTNDIFAGKMRRHLQEISYYNAKQVSPVITLKELAAKLWIEIGTGDKEALLSLPNSQLLLSCDRALKFNRRVVDKARAELARVKPEQLQQFELLLDLPRSARAVMDVTLNNEKYVTGDTFDQILEAAVEAAGAEVSAKARAQRARDHEKFKSDLAAAEQKIAAEKEQVEVERERAIKQERFAVELANRQSQTDSAMLRAAGDAATRRFVWWRHWLRIVSIFVAVVPLVGTLIAYSQDGVGLSVVALSLLTSMIGSAAAMDRPGAWLSRIIQSNIEKNGERQMREIGRHDLAEYLQFIWRDGVATAILQNGAASKTPSE